jgi:hypothetical protein
MGVGEDPRICRGRDANGALRHPSAILGQHQTGTLRAMLMRTRPQRQSEAEQTPSGDVPPPSLWMLALEFRAPWEWGSVVPSLPLLHRAPRGDGHAVIVFPGLSASDTSTLPLRKYLNSMGYAAEGWEQGFNFGPRAGVLDAIKRQIYAAAARSGGKVSLVGWSLGGVYAREMAKELPDLVRGVVTLGTPVSCGPRSTNAWRIYETLSGREVDRDEHQFDLHVAPHVPTTSVFSRTDGIVPWQGSLQAPQPHNAQTENVEVVASHFGIGLTPSAWWVVADRLAQAEGAWTPFVPPKLLGLSGWVFPQRA